MLDRGSQVCLDILDTFIKTIKAIDILFCFGGWRREGGYHFIYTLCIKSEMTSKSVIKL